MAALQLVTQPITDIVFVIVTGVPILFTHVNVYDLLTVIFDCVSNPFGMLFDPLQLPEAVQLTTSGEAAHWRVDESPEATVAGLAMNVSVGVGGGGVPAVNVAKTVLPPLMATVQVLPDELLHPAQLTLFPLVGDAVRVTDVPLTKLKLQVSPLAEGLEQVMPDPVTNPVPVPAVATERV